jgi:hypothetical protein
LIFDSILKKQLELENMPVEFGQVEREFYKHNRLIMEIEQFRDRLHEAKTYMVSWIVSVEVINWWSKSIFFVAENRE